MTDRVVRFTDAKGAEVDADLSLETLETLLDQLDGADEEHATVSVTDSQEWNLEFSSSQVLFENVGAEGEEVGSLELLDRQEARAVAAEFIAGDFEALRARSWSP